MGAIQPRGFKTFDGHMRMAQVVFNGPASYTTGGDDFKGKEVGLDTVVGSGMLIGHNAANVPTHFAFIALPDNGANNTLEGIVSAKMFVMTVAGAQVANATDLSAVTFRGVVFGH